MAVFRVLRDWAMMGVDGQAGTARRAAGASRWRRTLAAGEVGLIFLTLFLWGGGPPPASNEAHYLGKARHYWDPAWCAGDFFLESADAHLVFYWTFGWVAAVLPLPAAAWVGRIAMWAFQAWSWRRLSWAVAPRPLFSVLSAALLLTLLDWCEVAGEWIADGVEAKGFAYGLVFLGIEAMVRNRWNAAWLLLGAASAFHVLVGGWAVIAAGLVWLTAGRERPSLWEMTPALAGGMLLALPGLLPGLALSRGVDPQTAAEANQIYVFQRLSHHLLPVSFPREKIAAYYALAGVFAALCLATIRSSEVEAGLRRLWRLTAAAMLIGGAGAGIEFATQANPVLAASLLRYYFFRLSDSFLPMGAALTACALAMRWERRRPRWAAGLLAAAILVAASGVGSRFFQRQQDFRPEADRQGLPRLADPQATHAVYHAWRRTGEWIRENTPPGARFLTPRDQQTFKWYAQRAEVVTWKDVPQDARGLIEWRRRVREIYGPLRRQGLTAHGEARLLEFAEKYDFQYLVIDRTRPQRPLPFERVYPPASHENLYYEVYRVPVEKRSPGGA